MKKYCFIIFSFFICFSAFSQEDCIECPTPQNFEVTNTNRLNFNLTYSYPDDACYAYLEVHVFIYYCDGTSRVIYPRFGITSINNTAQITLPDINNVGIDRIIWSYFTRCGPGPGARSCHYSEFVNCEYSASNFLFMDLDCDTVEPDPCIEGTRPNVTIACNPDNGLACLRVDNIWVHLGAPYDYCPRVSCFDDSMAGDIVSFTFCEWNTDSNCATGEGCCWDYDLVVPNCNSNCPPFPLQEQLQYVCEPTTGYFQLELEDFLVCPNSLPPSAAGDTVDVVLCSWQGGSIGNGDLTDCETGRCCETFQVVVPDSCLRDCPPFPEVEDIMFECYPEGAGIGVSAAGFRPCPNILPLSEAGNIVEVELCAFEGGGSTDDWAENCDIPGRCCETFMVQVPPLPTTNCADFNNFWDIDGPGQFTWSQTFMSGITATIDVNFNAMGISDQLIIMINGTAIVNQIVGEQECSNGEPVFNTSFCVYPCDQVNIIVNAATCSPDYPEPTGWDLTLSCEEGCLPGITEETGISSRFRQVNKHDNLLNEEFIIRPNPTSDYISFGVAEDFIGRYQIFDFSGRLVKEGDYDFSIKKIRTKELLSGTYILRLKSSTTGEHYIEKFIKTDSFDE